MLNVESILVSAHNYAARIVISFQHELIRQTRKIDIRSVVPDAKRRNDALATQDICDLLLSKNLVHKTYVPGVTISQFKPLQLLIEASRLLQI